MIWPVLACRKWCLAWLKSSVRVGKRDSQKIRPVKSVEILVIPFTLRRKIKFTEITGLLA